MTTTKKSPFNDFEGNPIYEGDVIRHSDGEAGVVGYVEHPHAKWRVFYDAQDSSSLCLQVGDKGRAVVVRDATFPIARRAAILSTARNKLVMLEPEAIIRRTYDSSDSSDITIVFSDQSKMYISCGRTGSAYFWDDSEMPIAPAKSDFAHVRYCPFCARGGLREFIEKHPGGNTVYSCHNCKQSFSVTLKKF